jgi:hypothetical protein
MARTAEQLIKEQLGNLIVQNAQLMASLEELTEKLKVTQEALDEMQKHKPKAVNQ